MELSTATLRGPTSDEPIPRELQQEFERLLGTLAQDLGVQITAIRTLPGSLHATVRDGVLLVPSQHVAHWKRFSVMPTALVRDIAYACKRQQLVAHGGLGGAAIEADAMAYAERFLRATSEADDG